MVGDMSDWNNYFNEVETPNDKKLSSAKLDSKSAIKSIGNISQWADEEDSRAEREILNAVGEVEEAFSDIWDVVDDIGEKFEEATREIRRLQDQIEFLLEFTNAVLITGPHERYKEIVDWAHEHLKGEWDWFSYDGASADGIPGKTSLQILCNSAKWRLIP